MILYSRWVSLSLATRNKIAQEFNIQKKGATEVASNVIKSDGYLIEDIEGALTLEVLQLYLGAMEVNDLATLWEMLVDRIEGRVKEAEPAPVIPLEVLPKVEALKAKKEFKKRNGKSKQK